MFALQVLYRERKNYVWSVDTTGIIMHFPDEKVAIAQADYLLTLGDIKGVAIVNLGTNKKKYIKK